MQRGSIGDYKCQGQHDQTEQDDQGRYPELQPLEALL